MLLQLNRTIGMGALCTMLMFVSCRCDGVPRDFFLMSPEQQDAEFLKNDFDTQYKIYICGQQSVEPPMLHLASPFAREGRAIVKPLREKLRSTKKDKDVRDIVRVFREMSDLGSYDVVDDKPLMSELLLKVTDMGDPFWQELAEEDLAAIRAKRNPSLANETPRTTPRPEVTDLTQVEPGPDIHSWYKFVGRKILVESGQKYDRQMIATYGQIEFKDGVAYLSNPFDFRSLHDFESGICVETSSSLGADILRRQTSLPVLLSGIYHRSPEGAYSVCRNGANHVKIVEMTFE